MGQQTQCPSTRTTRSPSTLRREVGRVGGTGTPMWRSLDEVADTAEFREFVEREFPSGASEMLETSRRDFIKIMGAGFALAGAATIPGCRRADLKIMPFSREVPEEVIPGKPLYYATSMTHPGGGSEGLLVETHEGRPTKIEGNPLHPHNRGRSSVWAQAHVLGIYDPDRTKFPMYNDGSGHTAATWDDFKYWWTEREGLFKKFDANGGAGLAFLAGRRSSPSRAAMRDAVLARWPKATWGVHEPAQSDTPIAGAQLAMGAPAREQLHLDKATLIVSVGRDFTDSSSLNEPDGLIHARDFAATRKPMHAGDPMSRLYVVESTFTMTGSCADHRLRVAPSRYAAFLVALAKRLNERSDDTPEPLRGAIDAVTVPAGEDLDARFIDAVADDLIQHRGSALVVVGADAPAPVHALACAMNHVLGNVGTTVTYAPVTDAREMAAASLSGVTDLAQRIDRGAVDTLICLGVNPAYDAPAELDFASKLGRVPRTITLSVPATETGAASTWELNAAHELESWGDTITTRGAVAPMQPMIAPLYEPAMSELEFLAWLTGDARFVEPATDDRPEQVSGYRVVRQVWEDEAILTSDFELNWKRSLHDGVVAQTERPLAPLAPADRVIANAARALASLTIDAPPSDDAMDLVFQTGPVGDGRFANCSWLQELPQVGTRVVWDNPALISPATAKRLGLMPEPYTKKRPKAHVVTVGVNGRSMDLPVWILPGMADNTIAITLGYGRTVCGAVGNGIGFNTYALRTGGATTARGATLTKTSKRYFIASTQNHWSMEGRDSIVRQLDKKWFDKHAGAPKAEHKDPIYGSFTGQPEELSLAEQLGELAHTPPAKSIYVNPMNESFSGPAPGSAYAKDPQWGMSIDLSACTGCNACTIACQAENNIPNVGKDDVGKGREMHWIRVDRYFTGENWRDPEEMVHQPVACVQCENAPCETVCPVNATSHGPEGLNMMVYNRCIGTRYCANNCPYKVRRFNFFNFGTRQFNGAFVGQDIVGRPENLNLIPPILRKRLDNIVQMRMNPNVTVRARGVMEKCTYCVQRINAARHETKLMDLPGVPDGFFKTACEQACPSDAITFGNILDESSRARAMRDNQRSYLLLGFLATRARTTHMLRVRNPNPSLIDEHRREEDPLEHHGGGHAPPGEGGGHNDEKSEHSFHYDPRKAGADEGYAMSLRVLADATGVLA